MRNFKLLILLLLLGTVACGELRLYQSDKTPVLASVDGTLLRSSQLPEIFTPTMTAQDSAVVQDLYVDQWILSEVKRQEATRIVGSNESVAQEIEKLTEAYRQRLLMQALEKEYTSQHLDTTITHRAVEEYYQTHKSRYILTSPLVRAIVVRLPEGLRQGQRLKQMFLEGDPSQLEDFINICAKNNYLVHDRRGVWEPFSTTIGRTPITISNPDQFIMRHRSHTFNDQEEGYVYLLRIEKRLPSGSLSPLEIERDRIMVILRNHEKKRLVEGINDSLLSRAYAKKIINKY